MSEALGRFGVSGHVGVEGDFVVLALSRQRWGVPLRLSAHEWDQMSSETRRQTAVQLARELATRRRSLAAPAKPRRSPTRPIVLTAVLLVLLVAGLVAYPRLVAPPEEAGVPSASATVDEVGTERERKACDAARTRAFRGDTLGVLDTDGWVVEIALLRKGDTLEFASDPGLGAFVDGDRLVWTRAGLSDLQEPGSELRVVSATHPQAGSPEWRELKLTFTGNFVEHYFTKSKRRAFFGLADALSTRLGATHAAVYARCHHRPDPVVGSWFRGEDTPAATAALVYFMSANPSTLRVVPRLVERNGEVDATRALEPLREKASHHGRAELATVLSRSGGTVLTTPSGPTTVTFPFSEFNRSLRGSLHAARNLGVAQD